MLPSPTHSSRHGSPSHLIRSYTPTSRIATPISFERRDLAEDSVDPFRSPLEDENVKRGEMRELQASRMDWERKAYSSSFSRSITPPDSANSNSSLESQQDSPRLPHLYSSTISYAPTLPSIATFISPPRPRAFRPTSVNHPAPLYTPYPPISPRSTGIAPIHTPLLPGSGAISSTTSFFRSASSIQELPKREIEGRLVGLGISGMGISGAGGGGGGSQFGPVDPPVGTYNPVIDRPVLSVSPRSLNFPSTILQFDYQPAQEIKPVDFNHEQGRSPDPYRQRHRYEEVQMKPPEPRKTRGNVMIRTKSDPMKLQVSTLSSSPPSSTRLPSISNNSKRRTINPLSPVLPPAKFHPIPSSPILLSLFQSTRLPLPIPTDSLLVIWSGESSQALSPALAESLGLKQHPENRMLVFPPGSVRKVQDKKGKEVFPWSRSSGANDWVRMAEGDECMCGKFRYRQGKVRSSFPSRHRIVW